MSGLVTVVHDRDDMVCAADVGAGNFQWSDESSNSTKITLFETDMAGAAYSVECNIDGSITYELLVSPEYSLHGVHLPTTIGGEIKIITSSNSRDRGVGSTVGISTRTLVPKMIALALSGSDAWYDKGAYRTYRAI